MVAMRIFLCLFAIWIIPSTTIAQNNVKVSVELYQDIQPNQPIEGTLTIEHPKDVTIEPNQITLDGQKLDVSLLRVEDSPSSKDQQLSFFHFQIPGKEPGLYVLKPISVSLNGKVFSSASIAYQVKGAGSEPNYPVRGTSKGAVLGLEAFIEGSRELYPTQKTTFGYRYLFNTNIELTSDKLPLLAPDGFKKIGKKQSRDYVRGSMRVREVKQVVEAEKPGDYHFGPSEITGIAYQQGLLGQREYISETLKATAPAVGVIVHAFPEEGKPASFNGAVGENLNFTTAVEGLTEVSVGDKLTFSLTIGGTGDLKDIPIPELCCQPGFPGRFKLGDLPPLETMRLGKKVFVTDLIPLSIKIRQVPSVEFSYFNPKTGKYSILKSKPIQVTVRPSPEGVTELPAEPKKEVQKSSGASDWPPVSKTPQKIDIEGIYSLSSSDLSNLFFGVWSVLLIIPIGALLLYVQYDLKKKREKAEKEYTEKEAKTLMDKALSHIDQPDLFFSEIKSALLVHLYECGFTENKCSFKEELPDEGLPKLVKEYLTEMDNDRFSGKSVDIQKLAENARRLFDRILRESKKKVKKS